MGTAAGADVRARDGHDAHLPLDLFFRAVNKGGKLLPGGVADEHRHILPHDAVGGKLCLPQPLGADGHTGVHAHHLGAYMEAHVLRPEHLVQDAGKDMLAGVLLHFVKAPVPVDAAGNGCAGRGGSGQDIHRMPDDARLLVDVRHPQHRAVRQGQRAPVGGLTAALRVEHRAVQRNAPAAGLFVRLCGKDDAFAFGAESVLLKIFFCALHSASTSCKIERLAMPKGAPLGELLSAAKLRGYPIKTSIPRFLPVENSLQLCYDRKQRIFPKIDSEEGNGSCVKVVF